jgi:hypothetical protein
MVARPGRPDLSRALEKFCAYAESLPRPVLIVLDTCEELEKFQPVNGALPQLDAAFELLEAVHRRLPTVRVVFGGRRPLARSGAGGWRINPDRVQPHLPDHKDYLAVEVIRGFSPVEARTYLDTIEKLALDESTVALVLERSVEIHQSPYLLGLSRDERRYNPFDLSLNAAVLREDPASVRRDPASTVYLNNRVVTRLGPGAPVLPAAVAMRRFDHDMLGAAAAAVDVPLDEAWPQFAGAEWVLSRVDPAVPVTFLEIDPGLALRLPAVAKRMLTAAADGFHGARDPVGRLIATIAGGLASLRTAGALDPAAREQLADAYRAVAGDRAELPTWEHLLATAGDPADPAGVSSHPPDWSGWLLRLRWLLARPDSKLRRQLASAPEATVPPELRLPAPAPYLAAQLGRTSLPAVTAKQVRSAMSRWKLAGAIASAGAGVAATVIAFAAELILRPRREERWAEVDAAGSDLDGVLTLRATGIRARRGFLPRLRTTFETVAATPTGTPREQVRALIPIIADTARPGQLLPIAVRVPPALASLCWEGTLSEPLSDRFEVQPWRAYDQLQLARTEGVRRRGSAGRTLQVAVPEQWAALVDTPGTPRLRDGGSLEYIGAKKATRLWSLAELGDGDVAVLMATAVDTNTGRLLAVRVSKDRQVLIQPDELDARDVLLIVCGEPGSQGRSEAVDHLATRDLRGCAADLMEAGAGAVVVLPSMPESFLRQALDRIGVDPRHGRALLIAVHAVGDVLRAGGLADIATEITVMTRGL